MEWIGTAPRPAYDGGLADPDSLRQWPQLWFGGGGGWWPGHPWLLPGPPPASAPASGTVTARIMPANMLATTLRLLSFRTLLTSLPQSAPRSLGRV
jgi:hypothetical protein